ncbi:MAG: hypothetical protein ACPGR2_15650 [Psychrobium sp.]
MNTLLKIAIALLGVSTGAMLLIAVGIAPYWSAVNPIEFMEIFSASSAYMGKLMVPLGVSTALITIIVAIMAYKQGSRHFVLIAIAAVTALLSSLSFPLYFKDANALIQSMTLTSDEASQALVSWQIWHWTRIVISTVALFAALQFLSKQAQH